MEIPIGLTITLGLIGAVFGSLLTAAAFSWWLLRREQRGCSFDTDLSHLPALQGRSSAYFHDVTQQMARRQ